MTYQKLVYRKGDIKHDGKDGHSNLRLIAYLEAFNDWQKYTGKSHKNNMWWHSILTIISHLNLKCKTGKTTTTALKTSEDLNKI